MRNEANKAKWYWRLREERPAGAYDLDFNGEQFTIVVDDDGCFETEGRTHFPLYMLAYRIG